MDFATFGISHCEPSMLEQAQNISFLEFVARERSQSKRHEVSVHVTLQRGNGRARFDCLSDEEMAGLPTSENHQCLDRRVDCCFELSAQGERRSEPNEQFG